jgi:hypothetical protein
MPLCSQEEPREPVPPLHAVGACRICPLATPACPNTGAQLSVVWP